MGGGGGLSSSLSPSTCSSPLRLGCRGRTDEGARITIPNESFHKEVLLLPQVLSLMRNAPGAVIKTLYCTLLHTCRMVRPKVQVPVCLRL